VPDLEKLDATILQFEPDLKVETTTTKGVPLAQGIGATGAR
jgi:hypothetical protein